MSKSIKLHISGMHCTSCSTLIEKNLSKMSGVSQVQVNYANNSASMIVSPDTDTNQIIQIVKNLGYSASFNQNQSTDEQKLFLMSLALSLPLLVLMFVKNIPYSGIISLLLTTPIQFYIGAKFYRSLLSSFKAMTFGMDSLIAIGTSVAYFFSLYNLIIGSQDLYFETAAFLITFVLLGKWLETKAKTQTNSAIQKLMSLQAKTARVIRGSKTLDLPIIDIKINDTVLVRPGESVPLDGEVIKGNSAIDESMITGESIPIEKIPGDKVIGGTINKNGSIEFKVTKIGNDTMLSQIIRLVEQAQESKAPIQNLADKISAVFVPGVIFLALLTFGIWYLVLGASLSFALMTLTAVIVIACPCALGLATPTALIVGTGKGAENGILIKGGEPLEMANKINTLVFDKTNTLTNGKPIVTDVVSLSKLSKSQILIIAASLEKQSEHPLAEAIYLESKTQKLELKSVTDFKSFPGQGVVGKIKSQKYFFGNQKLIATKLDLSEFESQGKTVMILKNNHQVLGLIAVADTLKDNTSQVVKQLKSKGFLIYMLTGDNKQTAEAIAFKAGIDRVISEVLPDQKSSVIQKLQSEGKKVAMIGDGINDSPALAQADLGIAMGTGTDIAIETGGIVLINSDLRTILPAFQLARETIYKIKQNLFFALFYNILGIPIAARVFVNLGLELKPELAGLAMAFSSISVVANSLLLRFYRPGKPNYASIVAPAFMVLFFSLLFFEFARLSTSM